MISKIRILEPGANERTATAGKLTPLASLNGAVVGFIDNTKPNFNHLIDDLADVLANQKNMAFSLPSGVKA